MIVIRFGNRWWYSRPLAIIYAWTLGLVIGVVFITLAALYGLLGTGLSLLGVGNESDIPLWEPVRSTASWWIAFHTYAISGSGPISVVPPIVS